MSGAAAGPRVTRPEDAVLRAAGVPALLAGGLLAVVALPWGGRAVAGVLVGALLTVVTLGAGPAVLRTSSRWSPPAVMVVAVATYGVSVVLLAVAFVLLRDASWLSPVAVGVAVFGCATVWMVGHIRAAGRLRVLAFGAAPQPSPDGDAAGHDGSTRSS